MRENITKVAERGERLDSLQDKTGTYLCVWAGGAWGLKCISCEILCLLIKYPTDNLAVSAQGFRRGANRVRKVCVSSRFMCEEKK